MASIPPDPPLGTPPAEVVAAATVIWTHFKGRRVTLQLMAPSEEGESNFVYTLNGRNPDKLPDDDEIAGNEVASKSMDQCTIILTMSLEACILMFFLYRTRMLSCTRRSVLYCTKRTSCCCPNRRCSSFTIRLRRSCSCARRKPSFCFLVKKTLFLYKKNIFL